MSFVRPEIHAAIWRWREVIVGAVITAIGANWAFGAIGLLGWVGWPVLLVGLAVLVTGLQRARIRPRSGGAGLVELDEAQLSYFLPEGGVIVPLSQVIRISIETAPGDVLFWVFADDEGKLAHIPGSAEGAEKLIDALSHFPGARYQKVIEASGETERNSFVIWQRDARRLH